MFIKKTTIMKLSISMVMVVALAITSCAQDNKKTEQNTPKEQTKAVAMQKVKMPVDGMVCNACQSNVKKTIKSVDGVADVEVNLEKKFAYFTYDPSKVKLEQVQKAVNDKGFTAGKTVEVKQ
ncbi:MAG: heavy-metal-associated domain-containing protein [Sphingobacteriales bacterium]|nr:heavy-metal-associated domain-containing protein [Sphingobacteriales bacterium]